MNDENLGRSIETIARWYEPGEPPDPAELDRRQDRAGEHRAQPRLRSVLLIAATIAVVVGGLATVRILRTDDGSLRPTAPASSDVPSDSSPVSSEPAVPPVSTIAEAGTSTTTDLAGQADPARDLFPVTFANAWRPVSTSPLSPRNAAIGAWTGREVLIFGGTTLPLCPVCDYAAAPEPLLDGAAYDPAADSWRTIAPPPAEVSLTASAVVVGDSAFVAGLGSSDELELWSYSVSADDWSRIDVPEEVPVAFPTLAPGNRLVFAHSEIVGADSVDYLYDTITGSWSTLPDSPFRVGWFDRSYLDVGGQLVLFAKRPLSEVEPDEPNVVAAAVLDESAGTWRALPDSQQLDAPYFADGSTAVNPDRGGADGGSVNGWERVVPNGGEFRLDDETWLPFSIEVAAVAWQGGVVGTSSAIYRGVQGDVYDTFTRDWVRMPTLPNGFGNDSQMTIVAAGLDVFVFGGFDGQTDGQPVSNTAYLLDADRTG